MADRCLPQATWEGCWPGVMLGPRLAGSHGWTTSTPECCTTCHLFSSPPHQKKSLLRSRGPGLVQLQLQMQPLQPLEMSNVQTSSPASVFLSLPVTFPVFRLIRNQSARRGFRE